MRLAGFNAGGDDYVVKPFIPKNLIYRIMALLRRSYKSEQEAIQIGQTLVSFRNATVQKMEQKFLLRQLKFRF